MFDCVLTNIHAATMAPAENNGLGIINNAAILIKDGKIAWIGPEADLPKRANELSEYVHNGGGKWVTPGLIDCHTHLAYAGNRADEFEKRLEGATYEDIAKSGGGIMSTVRATRAATQEQIFELTLSRMRALFREGVTTVEIKSGYGLDLEAEAKLLEAATQLRDETALRVQRTFLGAHAVPAEYKGRQDEYIDFVCSMIKPLQEEDLIDAVDVFCDNIGFTPEQTEKVFRQAADLNLPVKIHAEQLSDQKGAALAARYKALSADHLEYIDEQGVKAMAEAGMTAVLLPGAFYYLREKQLPPIDLFRKHKVPMALATDHNPGTSPCLSLLLMLNMGCTLFLMTPEECLQGVTRHAAQALGFQKICGTLENGKVADMALWNISHPRDLCYNFGFNPCTAVIVGGDYHPFEDE